MNGQESPPAAPAYLRRDDPITVLHVDDDPEFADLTAAALDRETDGLDVVTETSAAAGLDRLCETDVDCVVSDYEMPGMDGLEFLTAVREDRPDLPFVLFTGKGSEEIASRAISAGATEYLRKGGSDQYAVLASRITNAVRGHRAELAAEQGIRTMEAAREGIGILDADGTFRYVNPAYADAYGYDPAELVGEKWEILYADDADVTRVYEKVLPAVPETGRWEGESVHRRKDGTRVVVDHALSYTDADTMICLIRDLTAERDAAADHDAETEIAAERRLLDQALDVLDDVFYVLGPDGGLSRITDRAATVTGYSKPELLSMDPVELFPEDQRDRVRADIEEALTTGRSKLEADFLTKDGRTIPYEFRKRRLTDADGSVIGVVGTGRDVSERRRRERQLERQLSQFEQFGSVLAHDLQTPLQVVSGRIELARETGDVEHLDRAAAAAERLEALVDDLATVMREGELVGDETDVDLAEVVREVWSGLSIDGTRLAVEDSVRIRADPTALARLLENLLKNAVDHGGDAVRVGSLPDGFYVADDGPGIPEDIREAIFETGYSTKRSGEGTGFGLASARQIAVAHGWELTATDAEDGGARFEITDVQTV